MANGPNVFQMLFVIGVMLTQMRENDFLGSPCSTVLQLHGVENCRKFCASAGVTTKDMRSKLNDVTRLQSTASTRTESSSIHIRLHTRCVTRTGNRCPHSLTAEQTSSLDLI